MPFLSGHCVWYLLPFELLETSWEEAAGSALSVRHSDLGLAAILISQNIPSIQPESYLVGFHLVFGYWLLFEIF